MARHGAGKGRELENLAEKRRRGRDITARKCNVGEVRFEFVGRGHGFRLHFVGWLAHMSYGTVGAGSEKVGLSEILRGNCTVVN